MKSIKSKLVKICGISYSTFEASSLVLGNPFSGYGPKRLLSSDKVQVQIYWVCRKVTKSESQTI